MARADVVGPDLPSSESVAILNFSRFLLCPRTDRFEISKEERKKEITKFNTKLFLAVKGVQIPTHLQVLTIQQR